MRSCGRGTVKKPVSALLPELAACPTHSLRTSTHQMRRGAQGEGGGWVPRLAGEGGRPYGGQHTET